ncbi:MAG: hypothetical protein S4CHLAM102_08350 [Chlamydiia bacterium]|nr:hypothetical protein [Chlamydiia bacterium]
MHKVTLFCLLYFPIALFGLSRTESHAIHEKAMTEWSLRNDKVLEYLDIPESNLSERLECLYEALSHAQKSLELTNQILDNIASKPKKRQEKVWRHKLKYICSREKTMIEEEIQNLQAGISTLELNQHVTTASLLHQQALEVITEVEQARSIPFVFPTPCSEIKERFANFKALYEKAIALEQEACDHAAFLPEQESVKVLHETLSNFIQTYSTIDQTCEEEVAKRFNNLIVSVEFLEALIDERPFPDEENADDEIKSIFNLLREVDAEMRPGILEETKAAIATYSQ